MADPIPFVDYTGGSPEPMTIEPFQAQAAAPQLSLGAAAPVPTVDGVFADMGVAPPDPGTMGSSMGAAAVSAFPQLAGLRVVAPQVPRERPAAMAVAAAAPPAAAPAAQYSPLDLERARTQGQLGSIYSLLAKPVKTVKLENPEYDIVQRQRGRFYGGGQLQLEPFKPQPFKALPRNEGETDTDYQDRMKFFEGVDLRQQKDTYDRQSAEAREAAGQLGDVRDVGQPGHLGTGEATLQAAEGVGRAELGELEAAALAQQQAADASIQATAAARAADMERRDRARHELDAVTHLQTVQTQARERLQALPPLDPDRYFSTMSGGHKVAALLGALAGGFGGGVDVGATLLELADRNLQAQKANHALVADKAAAADDAVARQVGLYQDLLRSSGDEQAADATWLKLQLEDAERVLKAQLLKTTHVTAQAKLKQGLLDLRMQIDAQQDKLDLRARTTPEYFMRRVDPLGAANRKALFKRAEGLEKFDQDLAKLGIEGGQKEGIERLKIENEQGKQAHQRERDVYGEAATLSDKIAEKQAVISQIDDLHRDFADGIPGVGAFMGTETAVEWAKGVTGSTNKAYEFKKRVRQIVERGLRDATGAAAPPAEQEAYIDFILEGAGDIGGEEKVWTNLRAFKENLANEVDTRVRGRSPEAVEWVTRNKALPVGDPMNIGRAPTREVVTRK